MSSPFKDADNVDIDVERLLAEIRSRLALRECKAIRKMPAEAADGLKNARSEVRWGFYVDTASIRASISNAEADADISSQVTPMAQFRGPVRWMALMAGKAIIYLSSFITDKQIVFNRSIINALVALTDSFERSSNEVRAEIRREVERLINENGGSGLSREIYPYRRRDEMLRRDNLIRSLNKKISSLESAYKLQENRLASLMKEIRRFRQEASDRKRI